MSAAPTRVSSHSTTEIEWLMARNRTVERHLSLAVAIAKRYRGRGIPLEDLVQVASLGLINAANRYDPSRNVEFTAFAVPTIAGEIKRHFRDKGWHIRVPRRLQALALRARQTGPELAQTLHRVPTAADIAAHLGEREADVRLGLDVIDAYQTLPIDTPIGGGHQVGLESTVGGEPDPDLESADVRITVRRLLARLPRRERSIVWMRYYCGLTLSEIASTVGMSQTSVARSLAQSLRRLRDFITSG
jgi:RNA polymerase sigma-B factor